MKLILKDLINRHDYWRQEIGKKGIWDESKFQPVGFVIRPHSKRYNGVFQRKFRRGDRSQVLFDRIIIYKNAEDLEEKFIDSVLVHEMIHQYIIQNNIPDSSTHGKIFKSFMEAINRTFPGLLEISLKSHNPSTPTKGEGITFHTLLFMETEREFYCCVVSLASLKEFELMVRKCKDAWGVRNHWWGVSNDVYFNGFRRCQKRLQGARKPISELSAFISEYNITPVKRP